MTTLTKLPPDLLTIPAAARRLGISPNHALNLARAGNFPGDAAVRIGSRWRVSVPKLEHYLHGDLTSSAHPVHDASTGSQGGPPPGVVPVGSPPSADGDPGGPGARSRRERSRA